MYLIDEYVDIKNHCTFKVGGQFRYYTEISTTDDLREVYKFAMENNLPVHILGGGSNMVFPDGIFNALVVHILVPGFEIINDTGTYTDIKIGAGENWDAVVERTVAMNLSGIEALSAIPGTVGATPVQNVGAYGQEIKDTLQGVEVFDTTRQKFKILNNTECKFAYRDSIFKHEGKGKYVITSVTLRMLKDIPIIPNYPAVKKYFEEKGITNPSLQQIREAIIFIRGNKLPDPKKIANVGSFFKNPIVPNLIAENLKKQYPHLITFPVDNDRAKIPAGWLMETAGLKGKSFGAISTYENNALVLVNNGTATRADVIKTRDEIQKTVFELFGINLETEPEFV